MPFINKVDICFYEITKFWILFSYYLRQILLFNSVYLFIYLEKSLIPFWKLDILFNLDNSIFFKVIFVVEYDIVSYTLSFIDSNSSSCIYTIPHFRSLYI